jgi:FAD:protein FMN transferase
LLLAACQTAPTPNAERVQRSRPLLGTFVTITVHGTDREKLQRAVDAAFTEFEKVDALLSVHRSDSELAQLNASDGPALVSPELFDAMKTAIALAAKTGGAFDPTIGPLAGLWGFLWREYRLPPEAELERVLPLVGYTNLILKLNREITLKKGMRLDFGGIGKGMAVDRAIEVLRRAGIDSAMVKAAGDLRVIGLPPGKKFWIVQTEDPAKRGKREMIRLRSGALSTSGSYENFFVANGRRYSHILDPRTGLPVQGLASCTVFAPTCTESDALATAFFVLGVEQTFQRFGDEYAVRFITTDLRQVDSDRFRALQTIASEN